MKIIKRLIFVSFSKESWKRQFLHAHFVNFFILTPQQNIVRTSKGCSTSLIGAHILTNIHIDIRYSEKHKSFYSKPDD